MSGNEHFLLPVATALESETGKAESQLGTLPSDDSSGAHSPAVLPGEVVGRDDDFWPGHWVPPVVASLLEEVDSSTDLLRITSSFPLPTSCSVTLGLPITVTE